MPALGSDDRQGNRQADLESLRRFHLTIQKSRAVVYLLALGLGSVGMVAGFVKIGALALGALFLLSQASAYLFYQLYRSGLDQRLGLDLAPLWMALDVALISWVVYLSGGAASPWFVWYLSNVAAAVLVSGSRAGAAVALADIAAYVGVLTAMGQIEGVGQELYFALLRMALLFGAGFFFLRQAVRLKNERRLIKELRESDQRRVLELSRLAAELDQANTLLREVSVTDPLTGLHNRRYLQERIREDVASVRRAYGGVRRRGQAVPPNSDLGFLLIDLDHFKEVNDRYSHAAGDRLLRAVARALRQCVRENDSLVRWGGEEFLVLVRQTSGDHLTEVAQRVVERIAGSQIRVDSGAEITVTGSVGWSYYPFGVEEPERFDWEDIVRLADLGLYVAKSNGRNRAVGVLAGSELRGGVAIEALCHNVGWAVTARLVQLVGESETAALSGFRSPPASPRSPSE